MSVTAARVAEYEEVDERRQDMEIQQDLEMQQNVSYGNFTRHSSAITKKKDSTKKNKFNLSRCLTGFLIVWRVLLTVLVLAALILSARSLTVSSDRGSCQCPQEKQVSSLVVGYIKFIAILMVGNLLQVNGHVMAILPSLRFTTSCTIHFKCCFATIYFSLNNWLVFK